MHSSTSCNVTGCKEPLYTPSGMTNFACKFWRQKEKSKQDNIRLNMERNLSYAKEAKKQAFSLDKLVHIRDTYREINVDFDAVSYMKNRNQEIDEIYSDLEEFFSLEEEIINIKSIDAKVNNVSEVLSQPVSEFLNGDVQTKLEEANKLIEDLKDSLKNLEEKVSEANANYKSRVETRLEDLKHKFSEDINVIKKILDNNDNHIQKGTLSEYINIYNISDEKDEIFKHFIKYQRFLIRKKVVTRNTKKVVFVVNDFNVALNLFSDFPNLIHLPYDSWKRKTELSFNQLHESSINIVGDLKLLKKEYMERINLILFDGGNYDVPTYLQSKVAGSPIIFMKPYFELDLLQRSNDPGFQLEYSDQLTYKDEYLVDNTIKRIRNENGILEDPGNTNEWEKSIIN